MPALELTETELVVRLNSLEKIAALSGTIRVPLANVRGATDDPGMVANLGIRAPGTGLPGVIAAGHFRTKGGVQFVFWRRRQQPIVIELSNHKFARLVLGVPEARQMAARINSVVNGNSA